MWSINHLICNMEDNKSGINASIFESAETVSKVDEPKGIDSSFFTKDESTSATEESAEKGEVSTMQDALDLITGIKTAPVSSAANTDAPLNQEEGFSSTLTSLASTLLEEGVLSAFTEDEIKNVKSTSDLIDLMKNQIKKNELADLDDDQKEYLTALRSGIPEPEYRATKYQQAQFNAIDEKQLDHEGAGDARKELIKLDFLTKGFDEATALKYAQRSIDAGDDIEDSKVALANLKTSESSKMETIKKEALSKREAEVKKSEDRFKAIQDAVSKITEVLPGVDVKDETKRRVLESITKVKGQDEQKNPVNEVLLNMLQNPEYLARLHYMHVVTDGFKKFDKLGSASKSKAIQALEDKMRGQDSRINTDGKSGQRREDKAGPGADIFKAIANTLGK
jgi:hypothetical protein